MSVDHLRSATHVATVPCVSARAWLRMPSRSLQRVRQFADAMRVQQSVADDLRYRQLIGERAWAIARHLTPYDRQHHVQVYDWLLAHGAGREQDADLLHAALLHDIGKVASGVRITVVHRVVHVLARRVGLTTWALHHALGLRSGLLVLQTHAARGASLAATLGASATTVGLIARHHDTIGVTADPALQALQDADHAVGA